MPDSAAQLAITMHPYTADASLHTSQINGGPVQSSAVAGCNNGWQTGKPLQDATVQGGGVDQVEQGGKPAVLKLVGGPRNRLFLYWYTIVLRPCDRSRR